MDAGGDWSGKPDKDKLLIFAIAALNSAENWSERCTEIRHQIGKPRGVEFHARDMNELERFVLLRAACEAGMVVGAIILQKPETRQKEFATLFNYAPSGHKLLGNFLPRYQLKRLWYDTEINGQRAQQDFETGLYRINRAVYPNAAFKARCRPSHKSDLVQLADCVAYVFRRQVLGSIKYAPLRQLVKEIAGEERNLIMRL